MANSATTQSPTLRHMLDINIDTRTVDGFHVGQRVVTIDDGEHGTIVGIPHLRAGEVLSLDIHFDRSDTLCTVAARYIRQEA